MRKPSTPSRIYSVCKGFAVLLASAYFMTFGSGCASVVQPEPPERQYKMDSVPKWLNDGLVELGFRPLDSSSATGEPSREYTFAFTFCPDRTTGERDIYLLRLSVPWNSTTDRSLRSDGVMDTMWAQVDLDENATRLVKKNTRGITPEEARVWFEKMYSTELFCLPDNQLFLTDEGSFNLRYSGACWMFERVFDGKSQLLVRDEKSMGSIRVMHDHVADVIEKELSLPQKTVP